jgi:hypothetical protein
VARYGYSTFFLGSVNLRLCLTFGDDILLAEQDTVAEESQPACPYTCLLIIWGLVLPLGAAVVEEHRKRRCRGLDVQVQPAC